MNIEKLALTAFGRFQGKSVDLGPGLNIIYGPNEAGKSTLQRFMLGMLYGFKKRGQRREYTEDAYRYLPWQGGEYRGALLYRLEATGRRFRVERRFDPNRDEVRVYDPDTGADLTPTFPMDRRKEVLFAEQHLGIPEEVFISTAWVGQLQVGRLAMGRELVARVANARESGRDDLSVRAALEWLEEQVRAIGTERAPTRPYGRICRAMEEKRRELDRAARAREETLEWEARLTEVRAILGEIDAELAELTRILAWAHVREAEEKLQRMSASGGRLAALRQRAADLGSYADFPAQGLERLRRLAAEAQGAREQAALYDGRLAALRQRTDGVRARLERFRTIDERSQEEVAALAPALRTARERLAAMRADAERPHRTGSGRGWVSVALLAAAAVAVAAAAAGMPAWVLAVGALAALAAAGVYLLDQRGQQNAGVGALHEHIRRTEAELARDEQRLGQLLAGALGEPVEPDAAGLERFRQAMRDWRALREELESLERERRDLIERRQAEEARAAHADAEARALLNQAGVPDQAAFEAACARREEYLQARTEADAVEAGLDSAGESYDALAAEVQRLRAALPEGGAPADGRSSAALQAETRRLEGRRADLQAQASDLAARIETATRETADIADLRRELQALADERQALDEELAALELARSTIAEVGGEMHREFAPRLNRAMGRAVGWLTAGRYRSLTVDEELGIRVRTDDDRTVELDSLSGGTIDQLYLGLRLALLDLAGNPQEPVPLILDDPFVQYDDDRAASALEFLAGISEERQVILMSCHQREWRMVEEMGITANLINLTGGVSL